MQTRHFFLRPHTTMASLCDAAAATAVERTLVKVAERGGVHVMIVTRCTYTDEDLQCWVVPAEEVDPLDRDNRWLLQLKPRESPTDFKILFPRIFDVLWENDASEHYCGNFTDCETFRVHWEKAFPGMDTVYIDVLWLDDLRKRISMCRSFYVDEVQAGTLRAPANTLDAVRFSELVRVASCDNHRCNSAAKLVLHKYPKIQPAALEAFEPTPETPTIWTRPTFVHVPSGSVVTWRPPARWSFELCVYLPTDPDGPVRANIVLGTRHLPLTNIGGLLDDMQRLRSLYRQLYHMISVDDVTTGVAPLFEAASKWLEVPALRERATADVFAFFAGEFDYVQSYNELAEAAVMTVGALGLPSVALNGTTLGGDSVTLMANYIDGLAVGKHPKMDLAAIAAPLCFDADTPVIVTWNDTDVSTVDGPTALRMTLEALKNRSRSIECFVYVKSDELEPDTADPARTHEYLKTLLHHSIGGSLYGWPCLCVALRRHLHRGCLDNKYFTRGADRFLKQEAC